MQDLENDYPIITSKQDALERTNYAENIAEIMRSFKIVSSFVVFHGAKLIIMFLFTCFLFIKNLSWKASNNS